MRNPKIIKLYCPVCHRSLPKSRQLCRCQRASRMIRDKEQALPPIDKAAQQELRRQLRRKIEGGWKPEDIRKLGPLTRNWLFGYLE